jgi:hypothetical protein
MRHFRISGNNRGGKSMVAYVKAASAAEAEKVALRKPWREGGFSTYNTEEVDTLPEGVLEVMCPHCEQSHVVTVPEVETSDG